MVPSQFFTIRGVLEGFYGHPWSHEERLEMLSFMQKHDFNAFFYAPKDDPYLREYWQRPHPPEQLVLIKELMLAAATRGIDFYYCISPGLSMEYANPDHFEQLAAKYEQMCQRGATRFALLFDDIPLELMHERDKNVFLHLADAQVQVTMKLVERIKSWGVRTPLVVCPTLYHGMGDELYVTYLGEHLPTTDVLLFWTGRFVCSPYLTAGDTVHFFEHTGHKPLYWDNYPVNDLSMTDELHIGPLRNRDARLYEYSAGYVANAMEMVESSKIPLITTAQYLRNPLFYEPEEAWQQAISEIVGEADQGMFLRFADNVRSSFLAEEESPMLMAKLLEFRFHFLFGKQHTAVSLLGNVFHELEEVALHLLSQMQNRKLAWEIRGWVRKLLALAEAGKSAVALIDEGSKGRLPRAAYHLIQLKRRIKRAERLPYKVCGNVMKLFFELVMQEVNKKRYT